MGWFSKDKKPENTVIKQKVPLAPTTPSLSEDELRKLDAIILVDNSGSMGFNKSTRMPGKDLLEEVEELAITLAHEAEKYDDDGLTLIAFDSTSRMYDGVTASMIRKSFQNFGPKGSTNLTAAIQDAHAKTRTSDKEVVIIGFTDGAPNSQRDVVAAVKAAAKEFGRPRIGFTLVQVGNDPGAAKFLDYLDNELEAQGVDDVVACVTAEEAEGLTYGQLCWLARNA